MLHMLVEAVFWFHPLVWWVGARLMGKRERACDEAVLALCPQPDVYAESILKVCAFCVETPIHCVSGITGADLKRRVLDIMVSRRRARLSPVKRALVAGVAIVIVAVPILLGLGNPAPVFAGQGIRDWEKSAGAHQEFEAASVRENISDGGGSSNFSLDNGNAYFVPGATDQFSPRGPYFSAKNQTLVRYIVFAYKLSGTQELALRFGYFRGLDTHPPDWVRDSRFDVEARAAGQPTKDQMRLMMQSLLAERFKLAVHTETRRAPVFALVLAKAGVLGSHLHVHPATDPCDRPAPAALPMPCNTITHLPPSQPGGHRFGGRAVPLELLATSLPTQTGMVTISRPVIDRTGLNGTYDFDLEWTPEDTRDAVDNSETGGSFRDALREQLGLKLESQTGPVELLVIDHVERPTPQDDATPSAPVPVVVRDNAPANAVPAGNVRTATD